MNTFNSGILWSKQDEHQTKCIDPRRQLYTSDKYSVLFIKWLHCVELTHHAKQTSKLERNFGRQIPSKKPRKDIKESNTSTKIIEKTDSNNTDINNLVNSTSQISRYELTQLGQLLVDETDSTRSHINTWKWFNQSDIMTQTNSTSQLKAYTKLTQPVSL